MDPLTMFMLGSTAINALSGADQRRRQTELDATDAKWSGFGKPLGYTAPDQAGWIKDLQTIGFAGAQGEGKDPGSSAKANAAFLKMFGLAPEKKAVEADEDAYTMLAKRDI
jgi:hypothetical protein